MGPRLLRNRIWLVLTSMFVFAASCAKQKSQSPKQIDPALIVVHGDKRVLRHDTVGVGRFASSATFVLVDVENRDQAEVVVTMGGELVDGAGTRVSGLRAESLRIPAGGRRVFALIDDENKKRVRAVSAKLRVLEGHRAQHPSPVKITDGNVYQDGDRVVVNAYAVNTSKERAGRVIVLGAFYDRAGLPMTRPFVDLRIPKGDKHPVQFVGPSGSHTASIFVGQMVY